MRPSREYDCGKGRDTWFYDDTEQSVGETKALMVFVSFHPHKSKYSGSQALLFVKEHSGSFCLCTGSDNLMMGIISVELVELK